MATIIIKNADFSGAPIAGYSPPVPGATLAAFVGDTDPTTALRNFGSGADLQLAGAMPPVAAEGFRTVTNVNALISDAYYTPATTLMAVYRRSGSAVWQLALGSERSVGGADRRGLTLRSNETAKAYSISASGNSGQTVDSGSPVVTSLEVPRCVIGSAWGDGVGTRVAVYNVTDSVPGTPQFLNVASNRPAADEADYPFKIGANYLTTASQMDVAFVGVWPFQLAADQRALMYQSVKKRLAAFGTVI